MLGSVFLANGRGLGLGGSTRGVCRWQGEREDGSSWSVVVGRSMLSG